MKGPVPLLRNEANDSRERLVGEGRALLVMSQQVEGCHSNSVLPGTAGTEILSGVSAESNFSHRQVGTRMVINSYGNQFS